ncbi:NucA/NucB deoxyribonuclease domain-containing protein [Streptomyces klenkii]
MAARGTLLAAAAAGALALGAASPAAAAQGQDEQQKQQKTRIEIREALPSEIPQDAALSAQAAGCRVGEQVSDRFSSCAEKYLIVSIVEIPSGKVIGTALFDAKNKTRLNYKSATWEQEAVLKMVRSFGVAKFGTMASAEVDCKASQGNGCTSAPGVIGPKVFWGIWGATTNTYTFKVTSPGDALVGHAPQTKVTVSHPSSPEKAQFTLGNIAPVRCDSAKNIGNIGRGCVHPLVKPVYRLSKGDKAVKGVAEHIEDAQHKLKKPWGAVNQGYPLHRLPNGDLSRANRDTACTTAVKNRYKPKSCDEYPFAGSYEGAAVNPDYSTAPVPLSENRTEGGFKYRGKFIMQNRVLDYDEFWVEITK